MTWTEIVSTVGILVTTISLYAGIDTYKRQNAAKRFEIFQAFNARFDAENFKRLRVLLDNDSSELSEHEYTDKMNFLGFFEEIAVAVNSNIMSSDVAFYFFGYYAIRVLNSENFSKGNPQILIDAIYWRLFKSFATGMVHKEKKLAKHAINTANLKF